MIKIETSSKLMVKLVQKICQCLCRELGTEDKDHHHFTHQNRKTKWVNSCIQMHKFPSFRCQVIQHLNNNLHDLLIKGNKWIQISLLEAWDKEKFLEYKQYPINSQNSISSILHNTDLQWLTTRMSNNTDIYMNSNQTKGFRIIIFPIKHTILKCNTMIIKCMVGFHMPIFLLEEA